MIAPEEYVEFLGREYLRGYIDTGGCAVKFAVADDTATAGFRELVVKEGRQSGYVVATLDAATTRVHLMEQIFFEVARQVDWDELAVPRSEERRGRRGIPRTDGRDPNCRCARCFLQDRRSGVEDATSIVSCSNTSSGITTWSRSSGLACCGCARLRSTRDK